MPPNPPPPRLTHFLCIPLVTSTSRPQLQSSLTTFRHAITNKSTTRNLEGIPGRAIRPVGTLHLTLGVMSLMTEDRVASALTCLRGIDLKRLLLECGPGTANEGTDGNGEHPEKQNELRVTLRGLKSMHSSSKTSILYSAPVDWSGRLQIFCQKLRDVFVAAGFIVPETRPLLLHATILNTIYVPPVRGSSSGGRGRNKAKLAIDASEILYDWEKYDWMRDVQIEKVAICRMGAKKLDNGDEEYIVEGETKMP